MSKDKNQLDWSQDCLLLEVLCDITIEVVCSYNEELDESLTQNVFLAKGDKIELDILNQNEDTISGQFGDGDIVYGLPKKYLKIISS